MREPIAKAYFTFGPMNSSKTATLIMNAFNYGEQGKNAIIFKPSIDNRDGEESVIKSRAGQSAACKLFKPDDNLFLIIAELAGWNKDYCEELKGMASEGIEISHIAKDSFGMTNVATVDCVLVDEIQFATVEQAKQLLDVVDYLNIPVLAFGLRNDFRRDPFPSSMIFAAEAEKIKENKGICWCGSKATHVLRVGEDGKVITDGDQICVGGNSLYHSVCRYHHKAGQYKK